MSFGLKVTFFLRRKQRSQPRVSLFTELFSAGKAIKWFLKDNFTNSPSRDSKTKVVSNNVSPIMGSSTSKEPQTKTFIPKTPVEFSSSLLAQLDNSTESDYTRQQYAETYIQQRVKNELEKLEKLKLDQLDDELTKNLLPNEKEASASTVASINERLNKMSEKLAELNARRNKSSPALESAESEIVKCLKDNKGKPLNCWEIAQEFQKAVNEL